MYCIKSCKYLLYLLYAIWLFSNPVYKMHHIQFPFHCLHDISNLDYTAYLNLFFISVVRLLFGKLPQNPSLKRCYSSALFRLCSVNWLLSIHPIIHQMKSVRKISRVIILKTTPWYFRAQQLDVNNMFRLIQP